MTADLLLLLTAAIWGFAFVAQRAGMTHMGPFTFNAIRFLLGGLSLLAVGSIFKKPFGMSVGIDDQRPKRFILGGLITGLVLFAGASLQQVGLVGTTAGKAGFITGLYVVLVPILGLLIGRRASVYNWLGALLAVIGLYLLSVRQDFRISPFDGVVLLGAFVWAVHMHLVGHFSSRIGPVRLAIFQFMVCGILSLGVSILFETPTLTGVQEGWLPLAYGSFLSVGLAYTLQVVAQRKADPSHAAIILSLESLFAAIGGWLVLGEVMDGRGVMGAALMLAGMLASQMQIITRKK